MEVDLKENKPSVVRMFAGLPVHNLNEKDALDLILNRMQTAQKTLLMFANSNFVVNCQDIVSQLNDDEVKIFNDGISMDAASKLLYGQPFKANLNGTDFTPKLLANLPANKKVVLIGAKPGIAELAGKNVSQGIDCQVVATFDGYKDMNNMPELIDRVNALNPDVVLIALGNPLQELWMLNNAAVLNAPLLVGVGALFDFLSNNVKRAPTWMRRIKLEWFYRLCIEPKRLLKRYTIDVIKFFFLCVKLK